MMKKLIKDLKELIFFVLIYFIFFFLGIIAWFCFKVYELITGNKLGE